MIARTAALLRSRYHPLHRLRKHRWFRLIAARIDFPISARLKWVDCPVRIHWLRNATYWLSSRSPEPEILGLMMALQRTFELKVFWDVGGNIGIYAWLLKSLNHNVRVTVMEPDPANCCLLRDTRRRTRWLSDVEILQVAASNRSGLVQFALDPISSATGGVLSDQRTFSEQHYGVMPPIIQSPASALDDLISPPPDLIKIDTEGHEAEVIAGAMGTIRRHFPLLILECFHSNSNALRLLRSQGYTLVDAERPALAEMRTCSVETTNYLALPPSAMERLPALLQAWRGSLDDILRA